jgi:hypothetical protein
MPSRSFSVAKTIRHARRFRQARRYFISSPNPLSNSVSMTVIRSKATDWTSKAASPLFSRYAAQFLTDVLRRLPAMTSEQARDRVPSRSKPASPVSTDSHPLP